MIERNSWIRQSSITGSKFRVFHNPRASDSTSDDTSVRWRLEEVGGEIVFHLHNLFLLLSSIAVNDGVIVQGRHGEQDFQEGAASPLWWKNAQRRREGVGNQIPIVDLAYNDWERRRDSAGARRGTKFPGGGRIQWLGTTTWEHGEEVGNQKTRKGPHVYQVSFGFLDTIGLSVYALEVFLLISSLSNFENYWK